MKFDSNKLQQVAKDAKSKTTNPRWIAAIDRAVEGLLSGELIVTTLAHGALVTSASGSYMANGACQCKAAQHGHKECRHRAAARLVERYEAAMIASPADERSSLEAEIKATFAAKFPTDNLADALMNRFKVNTLSFLNIDFLHRILAAIA